MPKATTRTRVMRILVAPIFAVFAVVSIVLGILNATVFKPSPIAIAYAKVTGARYIVSDPGVLNLVDSRVRVTVATEKARKRFCIGVGLAKDARGWVEGFPTKRITGLRNWEQLEVADVARGDNNASSTNNAEDVDFKDSHLWSSVSCQLGLSRLFVDTAELARINNTVSLGGEPQTNTKHRAHEHEEDAQRSISSAERAKQARYVFVIDLGDSNTVAHIDMRWRRHHLPDFATPLYFIGALFLLLAILSATVFAIPPHRRRNKRLVASSSLVEPQGDLVEQEDREDTVQEEVSITQAFAGTFQALIGSRRTRGRRKKAQGARYGRHGSQLQSNATDKDHASKPVLHTTDVAETTVISGDELQQYFKRFAEENGASNPNEVSANVMATITKTLHEQNGQTRETGTASHHQTHRAAWRDGHGVSYVKSRRKLYNKSRKGVLGLQDGAKSADETHAEERTASGRPDRKSIYTPGKYRELYHSQRQHHRPVLNQSHHNDQDENTDALSATRTRASQQRIAYYGKRPHSYRDRAQAHYPLIGEADAGHQTNRSHRQSTNKKRGNEA